MSMDCPNEYELAIEAYGAAVRREGEAWKALEVATTEKVQACDARQAAWRVVSAFVAEGKIEPGIYRLNRGPGMHADGLLIERHHDYPDLFPMFR